MADRLASDGQKKKSRFSTFLDVANRRHLRSKMFPDKMTGVNGSSPFTKEGGGEGGL